jgi:hypothetical protein
MGVPDAAPSDAEMPLDATSNEMDASSGWSDASTTDPAPDEEGSVPDAGAWISPSTPRSETPSCTGNALACSARSYSTCTKGIGCTLDDYCYGSAPQGHRMKSMIISITCEFRIAESSVS